MALVKINEILEGCCTDQKVTVRGWVYRKREGKELIFLVIRDSTGVIQCTVKKTSPGWSEAQKLTIESSRHHLKAPQKRINVLQAALKSAQKPSI